MRDFSGIDFAVIRTAWLSVGDHDGGLSWAVGVGFGFESKAEWEDIC